MGKHSKQEFCENEYCENPGAVIVPVSCEKAADEERKLCTACENAYSIGVQHGLMVARSRPWLDRFVKRGGFVALAINKNDPSPDAPYEAWAYKGPLDFARATPVTFGVGPNPTKAMDNLNSKLTPKSKRKEQP